jgi:hypothetical protein
MDPSHLIAGLGGSGAPRRNLLCGRTALADIAPASNLSWRQRGCLAFSSSLSSIVLVVLFSCAICCCCCQLDFLMRKCPLTQHLQNKQSRVCIIMCASIFENLHGTFNLPKRVQGFSNHSVAARRCRERLGRPQRPAPKVGYRTASMGRMVGWNALRPIHALRI